LGGIVVLEGKGVFRAGAFVGYGIARKLIHMRRVDWFSGDAKRTASRIN
jgi:hypothetical protein